MDSASGPGAGAIIRGLSETPFPEPAERLAVEPTSAGLIEASRAFDAFGASRGLPVEVRRRMLLVLDEVLSNVVHHGYQGHASSAEPVHLTFAASAGRLIVEVSDGARAFNPLEAPPPDTTLSLEARVPGGLGIALVRAMLSRVDYARREHRNVLTLTLDLPPAASGDVNGDS